MAGECHPWFGLISSTAVFSLAQPGAALHSSPPDIRQDMLGNLRQQNSSKYRRAHPLEVARRAASASSRMTWGPFHRPAEMSSLAG